MNRSNQKDHFGAQMLIYLMGLVIGGLYVGMVSPARTVIQADFGIGSELGIWMINIYTLFYAALIPVIGKLADIYGRKRIFMTCLGIFSLGAVLCGISAFLSGMPVLLAGRVVQAVGACGLIPVANAEMGTSFPEDKRGLALGLAAAVSGISNVLGAAVGSAVLGLLGEANWSWLFYIGIPFCVATFVGAAIFLPNHKGREEGRLDIPGSVVFVLMVLALLIGLQDLDLFHLTSAISDVRVWGAFLVFAALLLLFVFIERRASSPVFHLEYLRNRSILVTMIASLFIGAITISMILVPELAEATLGAKVGSGGYYTLAVGIFAMFGPPIGGKLIDRIGPKKILIIGLAIGAAGYLFLAYAAIPAHSSALLIAGLCIMGLGMGFSMGAPCNYMILANTSPEESTSAIATITLVRQVGTSTAPAILVGFTTAGLGIAGYQNMLLCVTAFCILALVTVLFYREG